MKIARILSCLFFGIYFAQASYAGPAESKETTVKKKILVVSSYHRDYLWSQDTNAGLCDAMVKFGYFDNKEQAEEYTKNDYVETSRAIVRKLWMDTKRKKSKPEMAGVTVEITKIADEFKPDIILLGDDPAAEYIGGQFLDTKIPVVFWGVNNTPVKYGLVDSEKNPGHNVTGVYQAGYYKESLEFLKTVKPGIKTFALVGDDSSTSRSHIKEVEYLAREKKIPLELVETIITGDFGQFKDKIMAVKGKPDAFFIAQYSSLKDEKGNYVTPSEAAGWYLKNVDVPEAVNQSQFVREGMLCCADDSGYNQGYEAVVIVNDILSNGTSPSTYPCRAPGRGKLMVNVKRAEALKITLDGKMGIEEFVGK
ncbi:MAG: ABC transporter substrate binding protein [bacterium]